MIPNFALNILFAKTLFSGIAYVIVLGLNAIAFSPLIETDFISPGTNSKSPCTIPRIFNFLRYRKHTCNLSARPLA